MSERKPGVIRRFFAGLMALISWIRLLVINLFFLFIVGVLVFVISSAELPTIPERGALIVDPAGTLVDQLSYADPLQLLGDSDPRDAETLVRDIVQAIELATDDPRITLAVLELDYLSFAGISKIQEIAPALDGFRAKGKKVIAVGDSYSQDQYLLASQADEIYLHPMGSVLLQGYGVYRNYFKQALDKLSIDFNVFRVGTYKSALEPFIRDDMSELDRQSNLKWLSTLWDEYRGMVGERRRLSPKAINDYVNTLDQWLVRYQGDSAVAAVAAGLVDGIKTRDEMNAYLAGLAGGVDDEGYYAGIGFRQYQWLRQLDETAVVDSDQVGLIVASGVISDGEQPPGLIGGDTLAQLVRQAREDSAVKAVVLRIDSGGGSAFASEIIRRELTLLQQTGKPLVVSMGSVAASGGYWIAAGADQIWATPTTLTGSIGIFGAFPTFNESLARLGITTDGVGTTELAGEFRIDRPMSDMAGRIIQQSVEHGYRQFIDVVAEGRQLPRAQVETIAEGRVWSGIDAREIGLVDELGGLEQAIDAAAELAGLTEYEQRLIEQPMSPQEQFLRRLQQVLAPTGLVQLGVWATPLFNQLKQWQLLSDPRGIYVYCMTCMAL